MENKDYLQTIDWEKEFDKDYIYQLERQQDIINSWHKEDLRQPAKIKINFNNNNANENKSSSFRRTYKKILHLRSHLSSNAY